MSSVKSFLFAVLIFLVKSPSRSPSRPSLRWLAGSLGMVCAMFMLFGMRNMYLYLPPSVEGGGDEHLATFVKELAQLEAGPQEWYVATQLTLDTLFPIFYGLFLFAAIGAFFPKRFQRRGYLVVKLLIAVDYIENLMQIVYLAYWPNVAIGWVADAATLLKFFFLGLLGVAFILRAVFRLGRVVQQKQFRSHVVGPTEQLVRVRFPLLAILFLTLWAPVAVNMAAIRSITANMLLLDSYEQVGLLSCVNTLSILFAIAMLRAVWQHIEINILSNQNYKSGPWATWHYLLVFMLGLITPLAAFHYSFVEQSILTEPPLSAAYLNALLVTALGYMVALALMYIFGYAIGYAIGQTKGENNFFPAEDHNQPAYLWDLRDRAGLHFGVQMLLCFVIMCLLFFGVFNRYEKELTWLSVPALLIMFVWLIMAITTWLSVWFDEARIPTTIPLLGLVIVARYWGASETLPVKQVTPAVATGSQSTEQLKPDGDVSPSKSRELFVLRDENDAPMPSGDLLVDEKEVKTTVAQVAEAKHKQLRAREQFGANVWQSVQNRFAQRAANLSSSTDGDQTPQRRPTLVVVTCPGGGIHAAAWAALVLEKLDERYVDFADSICMISGVSGGSVGTVFFTKNRFLSTPPPKIISSGAWKETTVSSLEAIGAGLAFYDIPASFIPCWPGQDRGLRLENAWGQRLSGGAPNRTLSELGEMALKGAMPIVVMNATDAASGRRILFSSVPVPPRESLDGRVGRPLDYRELIDYPKYDINIETAARASATFPYVSPFAFPQQASQMGRRVAICDGGFADNEGIVTAIDWLDFVVRKASEETTAKRPVPFDRILLLRIQPSSDLEVQSGDDRGFTAASQLRWLTGPLEALASMRVTSQVERGLLETDLTSALAATPWWLAKSLTQTGPVQSSGTVMDKTTTDIVNQLTIEEMKKIDQNRMEVNAAELETKIRMNEAAQKFRSKMGSQANNEQSSTAQLDTIPETPESELPLRPVVPLAVCTITFVHPQPGDPIPLNWKLSPNQMTWYEGAWNLLIKDSAFGVTGDPTRGPLYDLDWFFQVRAK